LSETFSPFETFSFLSLFAALFAFRFLSLLLGREAAPAGTPEIARKKPIQKSVTSNLLAATSGAMATEETVRGRLDNSGNHAASCTEPVLRPRRIHAQKSPPASRSMSSCAFWLGHERHYLRWGERPVVKHDLVNGAD